jgi:hypothetical protein
MIARYLLEIDEPAIFLPDLGVSTTEAALCRAVHHLERVTGTRRSHVMRSMCMEARVDLSSRRAPRSTWGVVVDT